MCARCARRSDAAGIRHELLVFEDEGHGIVKPKNQRVLYARLAEFFATAFDGPKA